MLNIIITLLFAYLGYYIAKKLNIPAPGMIGSMISVGFLSVVFQNAYFPSEIRVFTQIIAGSFIGIQIHKKDFMSFKQLYKPCLLLIFMLTINTFLVGVIIHEFCGVDIMTALLSCCAGGATDISLIAMDMGAKTSTVAMMQVLRLFIVILCFPAWIKFLVRNEHEVIDKYVEPKVSISNGFNLLLTKVLKTNNIRLCFTLLVALIFGLMGSASGIPSGALVFAMLSTAFLNCTTRHAYMPLTIKTGAQIFAGALVGCTLTRETIINFQKLVLPVFLLITSYLLVNLIFSLICKKKKYLDMKSALFASCPAGVSDMALIAGDLGGDMAKTALIQVVRLVFVIACMPTLSQIFVNVFYK